MKHFIAAVAVVLAATACSHSGSEERAFQWTTELPAGSVVHLRNGSGDIEVKRASGQTAQVFGSRHWRRGRSRDVNFVVTQKGNEYYICAMWRNSGKCGASGYRGKNTGGFLSMFSLFNRTTDASAAFEVELPANVMVDATTSTGEVSVDGITGGVTARTVSGEVKAVNSGGRISLQSTNGDVTFAAGPGATVDAVALSTTNGDIHAALPAEVEGVFDLSTVNGDVRSDFPLERTSSGPVGQHLKGQIGASDRKVKLRSVNGSVVVTRAGSAGSQ